MNEKSDHPVSVKVDVGAKLEVKAEIPTSSVGRFVDALTDIIRPLSEGRGLKADLIRLQREEVAYEIAKRAVKRIAVENNPQPIPLKTLIPLLEKGSQEEASDDFMIDLWANLLTSAGTANSDVSPRFVGIIGELNRRQAKLLIDITTGEPYRRKTHSAKTLRLHNDLHNESLTQSGIEWRMSQLLNDPSCSTKDFLKAALGFFSVSGLFLQRLETSYTTGGRTYMKYWTKASTELETDLPILESLGLLRRGEAHLRSERRKMTKVDITYYTDTEFGHQLLRRVGVHGIYIPDPMLVHVLN